MLFSDALFLLTRETLVHTRPRMYPEEIVVWRKLMCLKLQSVYLSSKRPIDLLDMDQYGGAN